MKGTFKKNGLVAIVLLIIFSMLLPIGCSREKEKSQNTKAKTEAKVEKKVIKIGAILPLTGKLAGFGEEYKKGIELAVCKSHNIEVVFEDGKGDPKESILCFNKLYSVQKVKIYLVPVSRVALAIKPLVVGKDILLFADAAHPKITQGYNWKIFRHSNTACEEANVLNGYIVNSLGGVNKVVAVIYPNDDYGRALYESLLKMNSKVRYVGYGYGNDSNFRALCSKVLANGADYIMAFGYGRVLGLIIRYIRQYGYKGIIFSSIAFEVIPGVKDTAGNALCNIVYPTVKIRKDKSYNNLEREYMARYGNKKLPIAALVEYNTVTLLLKAINAVHDDNPKKIAEYIKKLGKFKGVGENLIIKENGDILPELVVKKYNPTSCNGG